MMILDTNVVSEFASADPSAAVLRWFRFLDLSEVYLSAITEAELLFGLELMPTGSKRSALESRLLPLIRRTFAGRILAFDSAAAQEFALVAAARRRAGRPIKEADAQIAAIARAHGASLATRDVADFEGCGVALIDPWAEAVI
jgi:hypothetical protein